MHSIHVTGETTECRKEHKYQGSYLPINRFGRINCHDSSASVALRINLSSHNPFSIVHSLLQIEIPHVSLLFWFVYPSQTQEISAETKIGALHSQDDFYLLNERIILEPVYSSFQQLSRSTGSCNQRGCKASSG